MSELPLPQSQRRLLYAQIVVCFGPLSAIWFLGVLTVLPQNITFLIDGLSEGESEAWVSLIPISLIIAGFLGLWGLVRVVNLLVHPDECESRSWLTRILASIGVVLVLGFAIAFIVSTVLNWPNEFSFLGLLSVVLPLFCTINLVRLTRGLVFGSGNAETPVGM